MFNFGESVIVIAAHPDDEILGVGGTIYLLRKKGIHVTVLIVTDGSSTQYKNDTKIKLDKINECKKANHVIGTSEILQWDLPDMRLDSINHADINERFEKLFIENVYDTIFVQNQSDINKDHQIIYDSVTVAARPYPKQAVKNLLSYEVNSSTEWGGLLLNSFQPNVYVDIEDSIEYKLKAMECYETELREYPHPRSIKSIENRAMINGNTVGYNYAEAFKLIYSK